VASGGLLSGYAFNIPAMLQMAVLSLVALALGMFVVKPILTNPVPHLNQLPLEPMATLGGNAAYGSAGALTELPKVPALESVPKDPVEILRKTIAQRSEESGHLLRTWIETEAQNQKDPVT